MKTLGAGNIQNETIHSAGDTTIGLEARSHPQQSVF